MVCESSILGRTTYHQLIHVTAGINFKSSTKITPGTKVVDQQHVVNKLNFIAQAPNSNSAPRAGIKRAGTKVRHQ